MTDKTDEEKIDELANTLSKSVSEIIIQPKETETKESNKEAKNMEIHHHSHSNHGKKNWKHYFWEFLMFFLAVFSGFYAHYQLEHKLENEWAKELAKSFYQEIKNDSITARVKGQNKLKQEAALKYLISYFRDSSLTNVPKEFAINFTYGLNYLSPTQFEPRTVILDQLRNSGSLRYFKNEEFQNLAGDLNIAIKNIYYRHELELEVRLQYINPLLIKHYDYNFHNEIKKGSKTIFDGLTDYERSTEIVPFHLSNSNEIDRKSIAGILSFYNEDIVSTTQQIQLQEYIEINAGLLKLLREDYNLK
jgi:hypothetical protein